MKTGSIIQILVRREIGFNRCFRIASTHERFKSNFLQAEYDTQVPERQSAIVLPFMRERSKVVEILSARGVVFARVESGVCVAFSRGTNQRLCFLNVSGEIIQDIFYNKCDDSIITVSISESDNFSSFKCRSTGIEYIRRAQPNAGFTLFESLSLKRPGFVDFDDLDSNAVTFSVEESIYRVFDLSNYTMLYSIINRDLHEIDFSPGMMLFIYPPRSGNNINRFKIHSIEDGSVLKSFTYRLHRERKEEVIALCNEKLLFKQENEKLQILDVRTSTVIKVNGTEFKDMQSEFLFLYKKHMFLTFSNRTVAMWNFRGELVTTFEEHHFLNPADSSFNNTIYTTSDEDLIISYGKAETNDQQRNGSINISSILTGKSIAKIDAGNSRMLKECTCSGRRCNSSSHQATEITSTVAQALDDVTALCYDEELNELYTGNQAGLLHVWSS
ncbi:hypothetical protein ACET3Z_018866 [Daucus carota]